MDLGRTQLDLGWSDSYLNQYKICMRCKINSTIWPEGVLLSLQDTAAQSLIMWTEKLDILARPL